MKRRILTLFLLLLAGGVTWALRTLTSPELAGQIRSLAEEWARAELGVNLTVGEVEHNIFLTRFSFGQVTLAGAEGGYDRSITARRLELVLDPFSLLGGGLGVREVRLEGVRLTVERTAEGRFRIEPLRPFWEGPSAGGSVKVGRITLLDAELAYLDRPQGIELSLGEVMLTLRRGEGGAGPDTPLNRISFNAPRGQLRWEKVPDRAFPVRTLTGSLIQSQAALEVESLTLEAGPADLRLSGRLPLAGGELRARLRAGVRTGELPLGERLAGKVTGLLVAEGLLSGPTSAPSFAGTVESPLLTLAGHQLAGLRGRLLIDRSQGRLQGLTATVGGQRVTAGGQVGFGPGLPFEAEAGAVGADLSAVLAEAGAVKPREGKEAKPGEVEGVVDARLRARGRLEGEGGLEIEALTGEGKVVFSGAPLPPLAFTLEGGLRGGTFTLTSLEARGGGASLRGQGALAAEGPRLEYVLSAPDLSTFAGTGTFREGLGGSAVGKGTLRGDWENPAASLDVSWTRPAARGVTADLVTAHLEADRERVRLSPATVRAGRSTLSLQGSLPRGGKEGGEVRIEGAALRLEDILAALGGGLKAEGGGSISLVLRREAGEWRGSGEAGLRQAVVEGERVDAARFPLRLAGNRLSSERGTLTLGGRTLSVGGSLEGDQFLLLAETVDPLRLEDLEILRTIKAPFAGEVRLRATAAGDLTSPRDLAADGTLSWSGVSFHGNPWRGGEGTFRIRKRNLSLEARLLDGKASGRATAGLMGDLPFRAELTGKALDREDLNGLLALQLPDMVRGEVDASVSAEGILKDLDLTRVQGTIETASFSVEGLSFHATRPVPLTYQPREGVSFPDLSLRTGDSLLTGRVAIGGKGQLEGVVKGEVNLANLPFLKPVVDGFTGRAKVELTAEGTLSAPLLSGTAELLELGCTAHIPFPLVCSGLTGKVELLRDRLRFAALRGKAGGGELEMSGDLYFSGLTPTRGQLTWVGEGVSLRYPEGLVAKVRARISLGFDGGKGTLRGVVSADEGTYRQTVDLDNILGLLRDAAKGRNAPAGEAAAPSWLTLDLAMETANPLKADLKILRGEASGSLRLHGNLSRPILNGRLTIDPGTVDYHGHSFEVTQGWVGFFNPRFIEPSYEVRGRTTVNGLDRQGAFREFTVDLAASGTPEKTDLNLYSDPALTREDIISLLTWGGVGNRVLADVAADPTAQATLLLSYQVKGQVEKGVRELIGFDRVQIDPGQVNAAGQREVWVEVEKNLGERLRLNYSTPLAVSDEHEVQLRYQVTDVFSLNGVQKGENNLGLMLDFSFEIE